MKRLQIPDSVNYVDSFYGLDGIETILVGENNPAYKVVDGALYSKDGKILFRVPIGVTGEFVVPEGVEEIANAAFWNCKKMTEVRLPEGLKILGEEVFSYCESLKEIVIPKSVEETSEISFEACDAKIIRL